MRYAGREALSRDEAMVDSPPDETVKHLPLDTIYYSTCHAVATVARGPLLTR